MTPETVEPPAGVPAAEAEADGIVDRVHPHGELEDAVASFAATLAVRAVEDVVNVHQEVGMSEGRRYERRTIDTLRGTDDHEEGRRAFLEKREPEWTGR